MFNTCNMESHCEGCLCLENGTGGENQLAHMYPNGCLWTTEESYLFNGCENNQAESNTLSEKEEDKLKNQAQDKRAETNLKHLRDTDLKTCVICKTQLKSISESCCSNCSGKEDRERMTRYQSFQFNQYKNM